MKTILSVVILVAVLAGMQFILKFREASKRKKEKEITDPTQLAPRKLTHTFTVAGSTIDALVAAIGKYEPRIAHQTTDTLIAYTSDAAASKYEGVLNTPPEAMPLRIIAQLKGESMQVQLDEDYGFQMFMGPAKSAFNEKYVEGFKLFEGLVTGG